MMVDCRWSLRRVRRPKILAHPWFSTSTRFRMRVQRAWTLVTLIGAMSLMPSASMARAQGTSGAQGGSSPIATSIASRTSGYDKSDGFIPLYFDPRLGKLLLELPHDSTRALLIVTQATGLGSNPIGIDRGSDAGTDVVRFDRDGERVLVVLENWTYRSSALGN